MRRIRRKSQAYHAPTPLCSTSDLEGRVELMPTQVSSASPHHQTGANQEGLLLDREWLLLVQRKIEDGEEVPEGVSACRPNWWKSGIGLKMSQRNLQQKGACAPCFERLVPGLQWRDVQNQVLVNGPLCGRSDKARARCVWGSRPQHSKE
eukprot:5049969-Amphidinium_carterae.1